jgi:3(or 17)beta-hydroxysteroid dehydrogenase
MYSKKLQNKTALVTGSTRGIGEAIVALYLEHGATVVGLDVDEPISKNQKQNSNFLFFKVDVSEECEWKKVSELIALKHHYLDILVNNAGINGIGSWFSLQDPENISMESWRAIYKNNLESVVLSCKYMIPFMKDFQKDASIINIASRSGLVGVPNLIAYSSSKASVINITKSVALYCADNNYNIRCNSINPGAIETRIWDDILGEEDQRSINKLNLINNIPLKKMGHPIDVAFAALYLASEESRFMTANSLIIDGGCTAVTAGRPIKMK